VRLLADLRDIFAAHERLTTEEILEALCELDESPWADIRGKALDARNLSLRLGKYDIKPKVLRIGERVARGYECSDLADAWSRYLPDISSGNEGRGIPPPGIETQGMTAPRSLSPAGVTSVTPATAFTPPAGPGRCPGCGFHTETQGHRAGCEAA